MLSSQLSTLQAQYQESQASLKEAETQLAATRTKLKSAEESASTHASLNTQLQQKLAAAESGFTAARTQLQQLQAAHQTLAEQLKWQREAWGEEQAAHTHADSRVSCHDDKGGQHHKHYWPQSLPGADLALDGGIRETEGVLIGVLATQNRSVTALRSSMVCLGTMQVQALEAQLVAACDRAEAAERQQQAAATAATLALSRAQHELQEARSAQFVAEETHKTADAAAKLLAQKATGQLCSLAVQVA
jgi:chromosome segregation ATPase